MPFRRDIKSRRTDRTISQGWLSWSTSHGRRDVARTARPTKKPAAGALIRNVKRRGRLLVRCEKFERARQCSDRGKLSLKHDFTRWGHLGVRHESAHLFGRASDTHIFAVFGG